MIWCNLYNFFGKNFLFLPTDPRDSHKVTGNDNIFMWIANGTNRRALTNKWMDGHYQRDYLTAMQFNHNGQPVKQEQNAKQLDREQQTISLVFLYLFSASFHSL